MWLETTKRRFHKTCVCSERLQNSTNLTSPCLNVNRKLSPLKQKRGNIFINKENYVLWNKERPQRLFSHFGEKQSFKIKIKQLLSSFQTLWKPIYLLPATHLCEVCVQCLQVCMKCAQIHIYNANTLEFKYICILDFFGAVRLVTELYPQPNAGCC